MQHLLPSGISRALVIREGDIEQLLKRLGAKLAAEREKRGISLNELATRAGISRQGIKLIEEGHRQAGVISLLKICQGLKISLWKLIKELETTL